MGVRVVDRPQVPALLVDLVEDPQLLLAVEPVGDRARVGVRHREDLHRHAVGGRDHAAALVRELAEPLLHDLLGEDAVQLVQPVLLVRYSGMQPARTHVRRCCRCKCYQWGRLFRKSRPAGSCDDGLQRTWRGLDSRSRRSSEVTRSGRHVTPTSSSAWDLHARTRRRASTSGAGAGSITVGLADPSVPPGGRGSTLDDGGEIGEHHARAYAPKAARDSTRSRSRREASYELDFPDRASGSTTSTRRTGSAGRPSIAPDNASTHVWRIPWWRRSIARGGLGGDLAC